MFAKSTELPSSASPSLDSPHTAPAPVASSQMASWGVASLLALAAFCSHAAFAPASGNAQDEPAPAEQPLGPPPEPVAAPPAPQQSPPPPVPSEPLGATGMREHVDDQPPEGYDLSRIPDQYDRSGFTLELGLGLAFTFGPTVLGVDDGVDVGLAPLSFSIGGFINDRFALMFRTAGTSWFFDVGGDTAMFESRMYGLALQAWVGNTMFLGAGVGIGVLDNSWFSDYDFGAETGVILNGRIGWSFATSRYHSFALVGEVFPAIYDGEAMLGTALNIQWQLL